MLQGVAALPTSVSSDLALPSTVTPRLKRRANPGWPSCDSAFGPRLPERLLSGGRPSPRPFPFQGDHLAHVGLHRTIAASSNPSPRGAAVTRARAFLVLLVGVLFAVVEPSNAQVNWVQRCGQTGTACGPQGRQAHVLVYDSINSETILFGGCGTCGPNFNDTWRWNGVAWMPICSGGNGCGATTTGAVAYDAARGETIMFGGNNGPVGVADTWVLPSATRVWVKRCGQGGTSCGPPARWAHAMAFDAARGVTVLFGGVTRSGPTGALGDTWTWNGTTWTNVTPASGPCPREYHSMTYDSVRNVVVLFGGWKWQNNVLNPLNDTWEWNGATWTQRSGTVCGESPTGPLARGQHGMVYDTCRQLVLLLGGMRNPNVGPFYSDIWTWNGTTWSQTLASGPSARTAAIAYDQSRCTTSSSD